MKLKTRLFAVLGSIALVGGATAGILASKTQAVETNAAEKGDTLTFYVDVTNANWWSNNYASIKLRSFKSSDDSALLYSGRWVSSTVFAVEDVDTSSWKAGFEFVRYISDSEIYHFSSWSTDFDNRYFTHAGSDTNGTWSNTAPTLYDVTITATFTEEVPSYIDLYIPGDFNGWSSEAEMTANSRTNFTYSVKLAAGSTTYKIVACYSTSGFDWDHQIDTSNQTLTVTAEQTSFVRALEYDFDTNMKVAKSGAVVTLTFTSAVASTINIYLAGDITDWATTESTLSSAIMTTDSDRLVFSYTVPDYTPVGTYEFKMVAMSAYYASTAASYDYTVHDYNGSNASFTLNSDTTTCAFEANSTDLSELGAKGFAQHFNDELETPCADQNAYNKTAIDTVWSDLKTMFEGLPGGAKTNFGSSEDTEIAQARANYLHIVGRYGYTAWTGAPSGSGWSLPAVTGNSSSNDAIVVTVVAASAIIAAFSLVLLAKRRKHESA